MRETDMMLARGLRGEDISDTPDIRQRAEYHGVAPLIMEKTNAPAFRQETLRRAMWELRHRQVLSRLLQALAAAHVRCVVMKGTALAYDLYAQPALRPRADTDLLIAPGDLLPARSVLEAEGFTPFFDQATAADAGRSQEPWAFLAPDGSSHDIDLHWQSLNGPCLENVLPVQDVLAAAVPLPRLSPHALAMAHPHSFVHACAHRAQHILAPYFSEGVAHYGGDRLIWLVDIDLLVRAMTPDEWDIALERTTAAGLGPVCHAALADAAHLLATRPPAAVLDRIASLPPGPASNYLLNSGRTGRAMSNLKALGWRGALRYAAYSLCPPAEFVRMKYPDSKLPLPVLYLRRLGSFLTGGQR